MNQGIPPDKLIDLVDKKPYVSSYETDVMETKEQNTIESRTWSIIDSLGSLAYIMIIFGVFLWIPFGVGFMSFTINVIYWICYLTFTAFVVYGFSKRRMF